MKLSRTIVFAAVLSVVLSYALRAQSPAYSWIRYGSAMNGGISAMSTSSTGDTIVSFGMRRLRWWSRDGELLRTQDVDLDQPVSPGSGTTSTLTVSPDGSMIALGTYAGDVRLYGPDSGAALASITDGPPVIRLEFAPDGHHLFMLTKYGASMLECPSLRQVVSYGDQYRPNEGRVSPDGRYVAVASGTHKRLEIYDAVTGALIDSVATELSPWTLAFTSPSEVVGCYYNRMVRVDIGPSVTVSVDTLGVGEEDDSHVYIDRVRFSADGSLLAFQVRISSTESNIEVWDTRQLDRIASIRRVHVYGVTITDLRVGRDDRSLIIGEASGGLRVVDFRDPQATTMPMHGHNSYVQSVASSPDGRLVASAGGSYVRVWETATGKLVRHLEATEGYVWAVAFSPDGKSLVTSESPRGDDALVHIWDLATGELERSIRLSNSYGVFALAFSPDSHLIATGGADAIIRYWDVDTGIPVSTSIGHGKTVTSLAFSPDGTQLVSGSSDWTVKLWDVESGNNIRTFSGHTDAVNAVAFTPDGSHVVSASSDSSVRIWNIEDRSSRELRAGTSALSGVDISSDGRWLAATSVSNDLVIWNYKSGEFHHRYHYDAEAAYFTSNDCAILPDVRHIFFGTSDGSVIMWNATVQMGGTIVAGIARHAASTQSDVRIAPNPVRDVAHIALELKSRAAVHVDVLDANGSLRAVVDDEELGPGEHRLDWRTDGCPSGMYLLRIEADGTVTYRRLLVVR